MMRSEAAVQSLQMGSSKGSGRMDRPRASNPGAKCRKGSGSLAWAGLAIAIYLLGNARLEAHPGVGIVMDARGNVYYTDLSQVWKIDPEGVRSIAVSQVHTHELCLDGEGNLYGEHLWYEGEKTKQWGHRVWRLGADGTLLDVIPARPGFRTDYSFVRDGSGAMFWSEGEGPVRIRKRAPDGTISTLGTCDACRGGGWMTVAPDGAVLFVEWGILRRLSPEGTLSILAEHLDEKVATQFQAGERHRVMGVWTDASGNAYVAVYGARRVKRIDPSGQVRVVAASPFPWSPTGGLVAPGGDLWLLEYSLTNKVRVRRIQRDGRERVY
jgi:hypothetical protein